MNPNIKIKSLVKKEMNIDFLYFFIRRKLVQDSKFAEVSKEL